MSQQLADQARILDLVQRAGHPEERQVVLAEVLRQALDVEVAVSPQRRDTRAVAGFHPLAVELELHQGVAPIEEDRAQHPGNLAPWRERSSWPCWASRRSRSPQTSFSTSATGRSFSSPPSGSGRSRG